MDLQLPEITEVKITLTQNQRNPVRAYASFVMCRCFCVRSIRIVDIGQGPFVAMPSRRREASCPSCGSVVFWRHKYCSSCRHDLEEFWLHVASEGQSHFDIAHPTHQKMRDLLNTLILKAFYESIKKEVDRVRPTPTNSTAGFPTITNTCFQANTATY